MIRITQGNVEELLDHGQLYIAMRNGRWWRLRRNGQTKRWKRSPIRISLPVKAGLRLCTRINEADFTGEARALDPNIFRHHDDVPEGKRP